MSNIRKFFYLTTLTATLAISLLSYASSPSGEDSDNRTGRITLLSTTSTENSGLLSYLSPLFKEEYGIDIHVLAMGTGQAIRAAQNGDGDLLLVHDKPSELSFMQNGYGERRLELMYNDFIIVGPAADPAGLRQKQTVKEAFRSMAKNASTFISRGDSSGTHKAELRLWKSANVETANLNAEVYREVGAGMGRTLNIAATLNAYTLVDRGTWLSFKNRQNLEILLEGDKRLFNQYSVITLNAERYPHLNNTQAKLFAEWLASVKGQQAIANFRVNNEVLFFANHKEETENSNAIAAIE